MEHYFTNNSELKSELRTLDFTIEKQSFSFSSDNGVFSKDEIDFGSLLLVKTILENKIKPSTILDVGCGYGFIGIVLGKLLDAEVVMGDVNSRAIALTESNIIRNQVRAKVVYGSMYEAIEDTFDLIVTNPPIRAGKEIVHGILENAKNHLKKDGELWFVIRKNQGAKSAIKYIENIYDCQIMKKSKGFYIIRAKNR